MGKRSHERINVIMASSFSFGNSYYSYCLGTIMNISEGGMRLESCKCLPCNSEANILIYGNGEDIQVPIKVSRIIKDNGFYDAMGITIMNPSPEYLELVKSIKTTS